MARVQSLKQLATDLCKQFPEASALSLARRLYAENPERFKNVEAARSALRYAMGTTGQKHRKNASALRDPRPAGYKPKMPDPIVELWEPFILPTGRVLVLSDIHIPFHSKEALESAVAWGRKWKPDTVVLNGDFADFYSLSRYERDPKMRSLVDEVELQVECLEWLAGVFKKSFLVFKLGNHENRWTKFIWDKTPELWGLDNLKMESLLQLDTLGYHLVEDNVMLAGKLPILHGHEIAGSSPVNPARGAFNKSYHSLLVGHHHATSMFPSRDLMGNETCVWSTGCLAQLNPAYRRINQWNHGFAAVEVESDGTYDVQNHRISADFKVRSN